MKGLESKYITEEGNTQKETDYGNSLLQNDDIQNTARKQQIRMAANKEWKTK